MLGTILAAGAPLLSSGINALSQKKNKTPRFGDTSLGKYLKKVGKEGIYSPKVRANIMGMIGREAGSQASIDRARRRGLAESMGFGDSVASARLLNEPGLNLARIMGDSARNIETENEMSKATALEQLAAGRDQNAAIRRDEDKQIAGTLTNGLLSGLTSGYQTHKSESFLNNIDAGWDEVMRLMSLNTDDGDAAAEGLLLKLMGLTQSRGL